MSVRAKFIVTKIERTGTEEQPNHLIKLHPVTSGSAENEAFFKWTPCGQIELSTVNVEAAKQFLLGQAFYVDFTPAP